MKRELNVCLWALGCVAAATLGAGRANAATVYLWTANGSTIKGYDASGTAVAQATLNAPAGGNYFSLAVSGTAASQNVFVADSQLHTLSEFNWNGTALTPTGPSFAFAPDPSGGAISPQEIALDKTGNLWTVSLDGQIEMYSATTGAGTAMQPANGGLAGARGIMIDNRSGGTGNVYVTVVGYGTGFVDMFAPTQNSTLTRVSTLGAMTVGTTPVETGQLRGVTEDSAGNIFYADSTWGAGGTDNGYICEVVGTTCSGGLNSGLSALNGPNELISGAGGDASGSGTGTFGTGCDVLFEANYFAGTVNEISTGLNLSGQGQGPNKCGGGNTNVTTLISGAGLVTGIALAPTGTGALTISGNDSIAGPTFLEALPADAPEPGTWVLAVSALLIAAGVKLRRKAARLNSEA